jgi:hypothetical protein
MFELPSLVSQLSSDNDLLRTTLKMHAVGDGRLLKDTLHRWNNDSSRKGQRIISEQDSPLTGVAIIRASALTGLAGTREPGNGLP